MSNNRIEFFQGKKLEILEMHLSKIDNQLEFSWSVRSENENFIITFYNVSRIRMEDLSSPLEIQGFEIVDHSLHGWDPKSKYEIRDFEDDRINLFCEKIE